MYKDIINYKLADNISEEHLQKTAKYIFDIWMKHQPGFVGWEIHQNKDGDYTDIVYWKSQEDAKKAEKEMSKIPNVSDWFDCYEEGSITYQNLTMITRFKEKTRRI